MTHEIAVGIDILTQLFGFFDKQIDSKITFDTGNCGRNRYFDTRLFGFFDNQIDPRINLLTHEIAVGIDILTHDFSKSL